MIVKKVSLIQLFHLHHLNFAEVLNVICFTVTVYVQMCVSTTHWFSASHGTLVDIVTVILHAILFRRGQSVFNGMCFLKFQK